MRSSLLLTLTLTAGALVGAIVGCSAVSDDEIGQGDNAVVDTTLDDDDDFDVRDRMGRPEMTNVTAGAGLAKIKLAKVKLAGLKEALATETDATKKAELGAQAEAVGADLSKLAAELGAPESQQLKAELAKDAADDAKEAAAIAEAKRNNQPAPTFGRRVPAHFRAYNRQHTFHPREGERAEAKRLLAAGIRALDTLSVDGQSPDQKDWSETEILSMAEVLSEDALIVNLKGECTKDAQSYMGIEEVTLKLTDEPVDLASCGGRTLNDDIIDDTLTMWIRKSFDFRADSPRRVGDSIIAVTKPGSFNGIPLSPASDAFPYLGERRDNPFVGAGACSGVCRSPSGGTSGASSSGDPSGAPQ